MRLTPTPISTSEAPTKDYRASLRLWHWGDALFITGQLLTILFLKVIVNARSAVPEFLQGLSRDHVTLSVKQANSFAHIISDRIWQWHVYIGLALAAFWLLRVLIELSSPSPLKYSTRLAEVARRYRLAPLAGKGEAGKVLFAKSTYALFYVLLTVMVITGLILTWADDVTLLHRMEGPAKEVHNVTMYLIIAFFLVHVAGVVWAELSKEPGLISRMVGGERKPEQSRSLEA